MKNKVVAMILVLTTCGMLAGCGSSSTTGAASESVSAGSETATEEVSAVSEAESTADDGEEVAEEDTDIPQDVASDDEGDLGDYHVKIQGATFGEDYDGNPIIVIHYDFTNNSDDAQAAIWALSEKAYQDGVELESAYMVMDSSVYDAGIKQKEVKTGITIEDCQTAFVLTSESDVEFEISELISFSDKKLEKTFSVE